MQTRDTRPSLEQYADPLTISERIEEARNLILQIKNLSHRPNSKAEALLLLSELVDKNEKLMQYTVLNGIDTIYQPTLLDFVRQMLSYKIVYLSQTSLQATSIILNMH